MLMRLVRKCVASRVKEEIMREEKNFRSDMLRAERGYGEKGMRRIERESAMTGTRLTRVER